MNLWASTLEDLVKFERVLDLNTDQRIQILQTYALLSVAQELSALNPQNTQYRDGDDVVRNGWGLKTHRDIID